MDSQGPFADRGLPAAERLVEVSRLCRALVSAIRSSTFPDVLDDDAVDRIMGDIRSRGHAGSAAQMLSAMILFAHYRVMTARVAIGAPTMTVDDLEQWAMDQTGIDPDLVGDCMSVVREMARDPRRIPVLRRRIEHVIRTWGPYALAGESLIYLSLATRAAADAGIEVDHLIQNWALREEVLLTGSPHANPRKTETE